MLKKYDDNLINKLKSSQSKAISITKKVDVKYCLLNDKKSAQKVLSKDLVYKGAFRLSSRTPHAYKISYELLYLIFCHLNILNL